MFWVKDRCGFTLIELLVVIAIIGFLASAVLAGMNDAKASARDAKRMLELKQIETALTMYKNKTGAYPSTANSGTGSLSGWKVSYLPNFLSPLEAFMSSVPVDPFNSGPPSSMFNPRPDGSFFYAYYHYSDGSYYGCDFSGPFVILAIRAFENGIKDSLPQASCGPQETCPAGGIPNVCRNWSTEFDYTVLLR